MTYQELNTVITRVGVHSKIIFSGDIRQSDLLYKKQQTSGFGDFFEVISQMDDYFKCVEFTTADIVRSGLVKDFLITQDKVFADR